MIGRTAFVVIWQLRRKFVCGLALLTLAAPAVAAAEHPRAAEVVVLAADGIPASVELAHYYASRRGIPTRNIIRLPIAAEQDRVSRRQFVEQIYNPLVTELVDRGLIEGIIGRERDVLGRLQLSVLYNRIRYVVVCRPIPYAIHEQAGFDDSALMGRYRAGLARSNPRMNLDNFFTGPLAPNRASVDAELATIPMGPVPITGIVVNPLYRNLNPGVADSTVLRVTRLDGPTYDDARALVDRALAAEERGLRGRAYVDLDGRTGGFAIGNEWLSNVRKVCETLGYDTDVDAQGPEFAITDRFDAPAIYFGWYETHQNGPFKLPGFELAPGALAVHIHSSSAANLRKGDTLWVGPLIRQGAAATVGNTSEPYLAFTHNLDVLLAMMADGATFGDASTTALVGLSWQSVAIGDALYQPFKTGIDAQIARIGADPRDLKLDGYAAIRRMHLLDAAGKSAEALAFGADVLKRHPSAALAYEVARRGFETGELSAPRRQLAFTAQVKSIPANEWTLYVRIARLLRDLGQRDEAFQVMRNVLAHTMPDSLELPLLREAIEFARDARESDQSAAWATRLNDLEFAEAERKRLAEEERLRKKAEKAAAAEAEKAKAAQSGKSN